MADAKKPIPEGCIELSGKIYPTWPYVLNAAHEKGLFRIESDLVQIPAEENGMVAIVKSTCWFSEEKFGCEAIFEAYGDASPKNVNSRIVTALIRMAETRSKGRSCRDACNIGQTMAEEIPEEEREAERYVKQERTTPPVRHEKPETYRQERKAKQEAADAVVVPEQEPDKVDMCSWKDCPVMLTAFAAELTQRQFGASLCEAHAKKAAALPKCLACDSIISTAQATKTRAVYSQPLCAAHAAEAGKRIADSARAA